MNELPRILARVPGVEVHVRFDQVVELIGLEKAEELCLYKTATKEAKIGHVGKRSVIPAAKRFITHELACFHRAVLLEAIQANHGTSLVKEEEKIKGNGAPNPELLSPKHKEQLEKRGLLPS